MKLFVEPMNATVTEVDGDGRVRIKDEGWTTPTLQELRAIIFSAQREIDELTEALAILEKKTRPS